MERHTNENSNSPGHEPIETDVRPVWRTAAVIVGVVFGSYLLVVGLMKWFTALEGRPPANQATKQDAGWNDPQQLQQLRHREQQLLSSYQWVDESSGIARIPVDRAMAIIGEKGLPKDLSASERANEAQPRPNASNDAQVPAESIQQ
jgi:hypothetical protein